MKTLRRGSFARNNFTFWCIALICFFFCFVAAAILTSCVYIALRPNETINNKFSLLTQVSNMKIRTLQLRLCKTTDDITKLNISNMESQSHNPLGAVPVYHFCTPRFLAESAKKPHFSYKLQHCIIRNIKTNNIKHIDLT